MSSNKAAPVASAGAMDRADEYLAGPNRGCNCEKCVDDLAALLDSFARSARLEEARWWNERMNSKRRDKWLWGFKEVERERIAEIEKGQL